MTPRRRAMIALAGAAAGAVYGYGLMTAGLVAMLGAGGASFFLLVATSPLYFGFASWTVVGVLIAWRDRRWSRIAVGSWLVLHVAWVALAVTLDEKALPRLVELARVLPLETSGAMIFWLGGQAALWFLVAAGRPGTRVVE